MGWRDAPLVTQDAAPASPAPGGWRSAPLDREVPLHETALAHGAQGFGLGAGPKARGLLSAGGGDLTPERPMDPLSTVADVAVGAWRRLTGDPEAEKRYEAEKEAERAYLAETRAANPKTALVSELAGGAASPAARLVAAAAPQVAGTGLLARAGNSAAQGAAVGAAYGAASGDDVGDVAGGALVGGGAGAALPVVGAGLRKAAEVPLQALQKKLALRPTPSAALLEREGVKLTTGQKAPESTLGVIERASADQPFGLAPQRSAAEESFMRVAQNKGVAPGAQVPQSNDLQGRLGQLFEGFDQAYAPFKGKPVDPAAIAKLPSAASMPGRGVDARTAAGVKAEVENALTVIGIKPPSSGHAHGHGGAPAKPQGLLDQFGREIPPAPKPPPKATVGDLMKVRENIRSELRAARQGREPNFDRIRLLEGAEDVVTEGIEGALDPAERAALQATDRQYARLMTATNAAPAGQTEFTPLQYLKQVERGSGRRNFKKGEAGDLQDLGEAARETFTNAPMTGFRPGVLASLPGARYWGAPISRLASSPGGQRFLFGGPVQLSSPATVKDPTIAALIAAMETPRPRFALQPGTAEDRSR
jgi:hypothetical protein